VQVRGGGFSQAALGTNPLHLWSSTPPCQRRGKHRAFSVRWTRKVRGRLQLLTRLELGSGTEEAGKIRGWVEASGTRSARVRRPQELLARLMQFNLLVRGLKG
jgi:hypothetical protein